MLLILEDYYNPMMHKHKNLTIVFVSPRSYWDVMKNNLLDTRMRGVRYYQDTHYSLSTLATALGELEKRTWSTPTPAFVRSNFGLYGPGTIIAMMLGTVCIGAVYFIGPSVFERSIHIWSLFVDTRYRRMGLASQLLKIVVRATRSIADTITYQTRLASGSMPLYLQMGPSLLLNCHVDDTNGDWTNPKVVLEVKTPKSWRISTAQSMKSLPKDCFAVGVEDPFWKQVHTDSSMQRKYEIIGYTNEESYSKIFLRSL